MKENNSLYYLTFVLLMLLCLCASTAALADVSTAADLKAALINGGEITLDSNIALTESLTINKDTVINMSGYTLTFSGLGKDGSAIQVKEKTSLTIKNAGTLTTSDKEGRAIKAVEGGSTVTLQGDAWAKALNIYGFESNGNGGGVLINKGTLNTKFVTFGKWGNSYELLAENGGGVYAEDTNLLIQYSQFYMIQATRAYSGSQPWYGGGGLYVSGEKSNGTIKSNYFYYCQSGNNGVSVHLDQVGGEIIVANNRMMEGWARIPNDKGSWSGTAADGGGIYVRICKNVTISGNTISYNTVNGNGGGIMVIGDEKTKVTLRDNKITENFAKNRGGGVKLELMQGANVSLESGIISDNEAGNFGGGIAYTTHNMPTLKLKNVFISENSAVRGAGIWCCPTSETEMYSTVGGTIVGNMATGSVSTGIGKPKLNASGDDIRYEGVDYEDTFAAQSNMPSKTTMISVTDRAFNGIPVAWYGDETAKRYQKGDLMVNSDDYQNRNTSFGLHGEISDDLMNLAKEEALLIITGNYADRGGGIASNSPIQIGEDADMKVIVKKEWTQENHPDEIMVDLYRIDDDGERVKLDHDVVLCKENNWQYTFENLPAYTVGKDGTHTDYTYEVEEQKVSGWDCAVQREEEDGGRTIIITLTNTIHVEKLPRTGDNSCLVLWMALFGLSTIGVMLLVQRKRA